MQGVRVAQHAGSKILIGGEPSVLRTCCTARLGHAVMISFP